MRGIRMRFEEQPGLCCKTRQAIPPPSAAAWRSAGSRLRPAQRPRPAARRLKALNDRKRMSLNTWAGFREYRRITPMALFATGRSGCRRAPGPPESLADWPPRRGSARRLRLHVAEHRLQAEQASHRVRSSSRRMPARISMPRSGSARRRACSSSLARPARGAGANGGSAALDGMQGRGAALDIALAELAFELGEEVLHVGTKRRNTWTISSRLPPKRPTISPRASTSSPASAAVAGAPWRRSCRDDRAGKAPGAPCRSASPHGRSCPPPAGFAVGQRGVGGHGRIGSPAKRPSARILRVASRPSISGICMSISTASNGTLASSTC